MKTVDFYYSIGSRYAYLAHTQSRRWSMITASPSAGFRCKAPP